MFVNGNNHQIDRIGAEVNRRKATSLDLTKTKRTNADRAADYLLRKAPGLDQPTALTNG